MLSTTSKSVDFGSSSLVGDLLLRRSTITAEQLLAAKAYQTQHGMAFVASLVRLGFVTEQDLVAQLHREYRLPIVDPLTVKPSVEALESIPPLLVHKHQLLPISREGSTLTVAMADPSNLVALKEVKFLSDCTVKVMLAGARAIEAAIERHYSQSSYAEVLTELNGKTGQDEEQDVDLRELQRITQDAPIVKLVNALMSDAIEKRASDIHIEPHSDEMQVRFRIDGVLCDVMQPPAKFKRALASRIKIMAGLDIAERRLPQDGRLRVRMAGGKEEVDFRVSVLPTVYGEKVVLRVLARSQVDFEMKRLGFSTEQLTQFRRALGQSWGMILVTGPTGSGKTTTLYGALAELNGVTRNISTAEDPVEIHLRGINQVQISEDIGLTFASALRAFLRQDPDVIMVGEIRDGETAGIAVKAALTGHLVLSTLHTNDAPSAVTRLVDMGVEPFLVASSVNLVIAQRLVRRICPSCRVPDEASVETLRALGFAAEEIDGLAVYRGAGCYDCANTGYRGREAIYEVFAINDDIRQMITARCSAVDLKRKALAEGMRTLRDSGLEKLRAGVTTVEELLRVAAPE